MKKITINEIAQRAGISKTTVSFYLNGKTNKMSEETKQRIQQIIDETGYEPSAAARAMKSKGNGAIGVIMGDISDPFSARALKGIEEAASAMGYQVLVGSSGFNFNREKEYVDRMLSLGTEGFIIQATYRFGMLALNLEKKNKQVVYIDAQPYDRKGRCVKGNNYDCIYKMISDCVAKDYEDFIMISDDPSITGTGFENANGFKDALQDLHRKGNSYYVAEEVHSADLYEYLIQTLNPERRTLIYTATARLLPAVYQAIRRFPDYMELFPRSIGLIGFDYDGWTRLTTPAISAVMVPAYEEGLKSAEELFDMIDGSKKEGETIFKCAVKWRGTTME